MNHVYYLQNLCIESDGSQSDHAMAVEGYATITNKTSGIIYRTIMVADGWGETARHLLFDSPAFTKRTCIAFNS